MLLRSAKHSGSFVWWKDTIWKAVRNAMWRTSNTVWSNGRISPYSAKDQSRLHQFWSRSLAKHISRLCITRGRNLERRHCGRRHWRIGGDGRIRTPRLKAQCKVSVNAAKKWKMKFPGGRWNSQHLWERTASGNIHFNPGPSGTRRRTTNSSRIFGCMVYSIPSWRRLNSGWWGCEKWLLDDHRRIHLSSSRCTKRQTVHAERRNISYSDEAHRRYQNNMYVIGRNVGENIEDYWNVDGERKLSNA